MTDPGHRSALPFSPPATSAGGAPATGVGAPGGLAPAAAAPAPVPASTKAKDTAPPKVKPESEQIKAIDAVEHALAASTPDTPEAKQASIRLRALYRLMVTGTGPGESWGNRLSPVSAARLVLFCMANGLDPSGNDLYILGDRPYVSFEGRLKIAHRSGRFEGFEVDRPMTADERLAYAAPDDALVAWISTARRSDCRFPFLGVGYARRGEANPVAKQYPLDMAQKRARANALTLAFPADVNLSPIEEGRTRTDAEVVGSRPMGAPGELGAGAPPPAAQDPATAAPAESSTPAADSPATGAPATSETEGGATS